MDTDELNNMPSEQPAGEEEPRPVIETEAETLTDEETVRLPHDEDAAPVIETEAETLPDEEMVRLPHDEDAATEDDLEEEEAATDLIPPVSAAGPNSAAPPRIVAETPLGGTSKARPAAGVRRTDPGEAAGEPALDSNEVSGAGAAAAETAATESVPPEPDVMVSAPAVPAPEQPVSRVTVTETGPVVNRAEDWDDQDLSPELASVLFGGRQAKSDAAPTESAPTPAPAAATPAVVEAEPPAEPIALTDITTARHLRITAGAHSAAAPDAVLAGKVRRMRIDEPLREDKGQSTIETWTYYKPDYPSLDGRLVKQIKSEEIVYTDGSWWWRYERRYSDGGRDRREVRTNRDQTYIERKDEVSKLAPQAGKRVRYKEEVALMLAAPEREEKRGFLSGLLGRDDDDEQAASVKTWRVATSSESRQARKRGGAALRRRFLGIF